MILSSMTRSLVSQIGIESGILRKQLHRFSPLVDQRCASCSTYDNDEAKSMLLSPRKPPPFIKPTCASDFRRLLEEVSVGSDPGETKYWLKQFQRSAEDSQHPFSVLQVQPDVFNNPEQLKSLAWAVSLLQKISLRCVVLLGACAQHIQHTGHQSVRAQLSADMMRLVELLEQHGSPARPLYCGASVIEASHLPILCSTNHCVSASPSPIQHALSSGHIPVLPCLGLSRDGYVIPLDADDVMQVLIPHLAPKKVFLVNTQGGLRDEVGEVVSSINVPKDLEWASMMPWYTTAVKHKIEYISGLLDSLSCQSSVVMTSADTLLTEIFTHHGEGTLFKNTEAIKTYSSLEDIDSTRLLQVINSDFGRDLGPPFLEQLSSKLQTIYLSEDYNAVAIVTREPGVDVPYLDKFSVTPEGKTDGICQLLWDTIRRDFPCLFWRSRHANKVSSWYFKKCEGSWTNGSWIVFWYGVRSHHQSSVLTDYALTLDDAFATTVKDYRPVL